MSGPFRSSHPFRAHSSLGVVVFLYRATSQMLEVWCGPGRRSAFRSFLMRYYSMGICIITKCHQLDIEAAAQLITIARMSDWPGAPCLHEHLLSSCARRADRLPLRRAKTKINAFTSSIVSPCPAGRSKQ